MVMTTAEKSAFANLVTPGQPLFDRIRAAFSHVMTSRSSAPPAVPVPTPEEAISIAKTYAQAVEQIYELGNLKPGWNSYKAGPIGEKAQKRAVDFLLPFHALVPSLPAPAIFPTSDGGVGMRWRMATKARGYLDLELIFFDGHGEYSFDFADDNDLLAEGRISDAPSFLTDVRKHLSPYAAA
jgi:hypothetical protein